MKNDESPAVLAGAETPGELAKELIRVEDARIERDNRQAEIQEKALEISNEQDKRQADFHSQRIELLDEADQRRIKLAGRVLSWGAILIAIPAALFLYMVFFGNEAQSGNALSIIEKLGIGVAGYGVLSALIRGARAIANRRRSL